MASSPMPGCRAHREEGGGQPPACHSEPPWPVPSRLTFLYQHVCPRRVSDESMMSSSIRKKVCSWGEKEGWRKTPVALWDCPFHQ